MNTVYELGPDLHSDGITAESFEALAEIMVANLRAQGPSGIVCGPITTGGTGHQVLNLEIFNATISGLQRQGEKIFTQIPYEFGLRRLARAWEEEGHSGYCMPILNVCYARLFESGLIVRGWFIPGRWSSFGAHWEHTKLSSLRVPVTDLSREQICDFLSFEHSIQHVAEVMKLLPVR